MTNIHLSSELFDELVIDVRGKIAKEVVATPVFLRKDLLESARFFLGI